MPSPDYMRWRQRAEEALADGNKPMQAIVHECGGVIHWSDIAGCWGCMEPYRHCECPGVSATIVESDLAHFGEVVEPFTVSGGRMD